MPGEGAGGGEELAGVPGEAELAREVATALCCLVTCSLLSCDVLCASHCDMLCAAL